MVIINTEKILVPNWYKKEHIENLLEDRISDDVMYSIKYWNGKKNKKIGFKALF